MVELFYPNNCYVCKTSENLKRCSRCQMISYCGLDHQKQHWPRHKEICQQISIILKELKISHVYEKLRGADSETWRQQRFMMYALLQLKLGRPLDEAETGVFLYPRTCFVCHEARQANLRKCPGCPYASFCNAHPSSSSHDKICSLIKDKCDFETRMSKVSLQTTVTATKTIVTNTRVHKSRKLPNSVEDYLYRYVQIPVTIPEDLKISSSIYFSSSLTLFSALQKLNYNPGSKMVLHVHGELTTCSLILYWEVLLHLLPNLTDLKISFIEAVKDVKYAVNVCKKCCSMKKTLVLEFVSATYTKFLKSKRYTKPDIFVAYNFDPPAEEKPHTTWDEAMHCFSVITCPWLLTTIREKKANIISEKLRSTLKNVEICYDGKNDFTPIKPEYHWETEGIIWLNQFLIVMKPRDI